MRLVPIDVHPFVAPVAPMARLRVPNGRSGLPRPIQRGDDVRTDAAGRAADAENEPVARPGGRRVGARRKRSFVSDLPFLVLIALVLSLLLKAFVVQAFFIPSGSMEDTLQVGDRVLVNKLVYDARDIRRGEVIVFNGVDSFVPATAAEEPTNPLDRLVDLASAAAGIAPPGERDFIKRVIGLPGDRVACCDGEGRLTVNGVSMEESYLFPGDSPSELAFDIEVSAGRLWVMGDHRSRSADSRAHLGDPGGGTVPIDHVVGRAFAVVWPLDRWGILSVPRTFRDFATVPVAAR